VWFADANLWKESVVSRETDGEDEDPPKLDAAEAGKGGEGRISLEQSLPGGFM
jgi:hypothetical protein